MTELDSLIATAYANAGKQEDVNKVYLALLRTPLFLPVKKNSQTNPDEFVPLFTQIEDSFFMLAFDQMDRLKNWAGEQFNNMDCVELLGKDVVAGIQENVYLCLNFGGEFYKEFSPDEVKRLKMIASRIEAMRGG